MLLLYYSNNDIFQTSMTLKYRRGGRVREERHTARLIRANFLIPVSPQRPQIEYADRLILPGSNVTARAGEIATLTCRARYGNPSPLIKWFVIVARRFRTT